MDVKLKSTAADARPSERVAEAAARSARPPKTCGRRFPDGRHQLISLKTIFRRLVDFPQVVSVRRIACLAEVGTRAARGRARDEREEPAGRAG
jgi:hypothetical protein